VRIGIIDTDADLQHPAFAGQKIERKAFMTSGKPSSSNWHGTGVLALLAGRPDSGTPGLVPEASFFVANIFFTDKLGDMITDTVALLKSLEWMNASAVRLINMSFAGPADELVHARLKAMRARGFVFTAAAGNEGPAALPTYPAAYPEVIAVTAVTSELQVYPSANRGPHIDVAAPGVHIWTAFPGAREGYRTGTSFAAPFATAVLALTPPDLLLAPIDGLLDTLKTIPLGARRHARIFGRGLLQAPDECSNTVAPVSNRAPVTRSVRR
jgi:subtilisin family serine protease